MKRLWLFIPLAALMAILGLIFVLYHTLDYETHDSPMVGQHIPSLILRDMAGNEIDLADLEGQPYLLHVGASWCESCKMEHQVLRDLLDWNFPMIGVFYRDKPEDVEVFLQTHVNPYQVTFIDPEGETLVNLGGVRLPSSYLVDKDGIIRAVFSGPLQSSDQVVEIVWDRSDRE